MPENTNNLITREFIEKTDHNLIDLDFPLHSRPFRVAISWMKEKGISGDILAPEIWGPLMEIYKQLYPAGDFSMPSLHVGGVGMRDQMYFARVNVGFGMIEVDPIKCIEISPTELDVIWKQTPDQVWRAIYSVADIWDFAYGTHDLREQSPDADQLWSNARSALATTTRTLVGGQDLDSVVQSACLSAELAMKGSLALLGWTETRRRKLNHNLTNLAEAVISCRSMNNDDRLRKACNNFPNYVKTRYEFHNLTRVQLIELGIRSQFVAAESLRRVSDRNFASEIEMDHTSILRRDI